jgi:hypothetical protein
MKRFTVLVMVVLAIFVLAGFASAADFTGKWVAFKMDITQGEENLVVDMDEHGMPVEARATLEFKDGKAYFREGPDAEDDPDGMEYTQDGEKLSVLMPQEAKDAGMESVEYFFEGDALCMVMSTGDGTMKFFFRRP